jgi:lipopolysaccharide export system permease protein
MTPIILHRHYLKELLKAFCLVLIGLFTLYVLVDYTSRASGFKLSLVQLSSYYLYTFVQRLDVLVPFALLIAGIKTLVQSNLAQELVAMRASGYALSFLLRPYLWVGFAATFAMYANLQYLTPVAAETVNTFEDQYSLQRKSSQPAVVHPITLADGSRLLYHSYDHSRKCLINCFWIQSFDKILRIETLFPFSVPPTGQGVEHFSRNAEQQIISLQINPEEVFPTLSLDHQLIAEAVSLPSERSLSQLWQRLSTGQRTTNYEQAQIQAAFYKRMAMPWLCIIALLAPVPFCSAHRRPLRVFAMFSAGIFGLFAVVVLLSVGNTLTQSQLLGPLWTLIIPMAALVSLSLVRFFRVH